MTPPKKAHKTWTRSTSTGSRSAPNFLRFPQIRIVRTSARNDRFFDKFLLQKLCSRLDGQQPRSSIHTSTPKLRFGRRPRPLSLVPAATQSTAQLLPLPPTSTRFSRQPRPSLLPEVSIAPVTPWPTHPEMDNPPSSDPAPARPFHPPVHLHSALVCGVSASVSTVSGPPPISTRGNRRGGRQRGARSSSQTTTLTLRVSELE